MIYKKPEALLDAFTCPNCNAIAEQRWRGITWDHNNDILANCPILIATCSHCRKRSLWVDKKMYYPSLGIAPTPNTEMPDAVKKIYLEAARIHGNSSRGAAALLRLGIQMLCKELGESGENINKDISNLVKKGLPEIVQQSLDIVRVTGNEAVHPGQIDADDAETVLNLFNLLNIIVEYMIALPKKVSGIYSSLPQGKLDYINIRDNVKKTSC